MIKKSENKRRSLPAVYILLSFLALAVAGCASIGRPGGGARDETPPVFVRSNPMPGTLNFNRQRIDVFFDENIQLDDAFNKVIVSPSQKMAPVVRSLGKRVSVELRDTLIPDATYTIDFGDAIKDLNEGNLLDGFALDFATGDVIDSLRISGVLLEAHTLEPAQGMLVGVYSNMEDSAITTLPLERVTRTNSRGQFTIRGLKDKEYRVFAINDVNRDNRWDRSEGVAFFDVPVVPGVEEIEVNDTLRNVMGQDSIVTRPGVAYLPADILLTWFNEDVTTHYLKENSRPARNRIEIILSAPYDSLATAEIVNTPAFDGVKWDDVTITDASPGNDTITWWIKDKDLVNTDSLSLAVRYPAMDTLDNVYMKTDTMRFFYRPTSAEIKAAKELEKLREKGEDTIPPPQVLMNLKFVTGTTHDVYKPILLQSETPWASIDTTKIKLTMTLDSVWHDVGITAPHPVDGGGILRRQIDFKPEPGAKYVLEIDSAAIYDIYDNPVARFKQEFTVKALDTYSTVIFNITPADSTIMVELLDSSDNVVRAEAADSSGKAVFKYVNPGTYYARMYYDDDRNGEWSPGNVSEKIQPEEVAYYPKKIDARANWDVDLSWNIYEIPLDVQKPYAILKNKPKLKKGEKAPTDEEEQEVDEWGYPINRTDGTNSGFGGFGGGMQQLNSLRGGGLMR